MPKPVTIGERVFGTQKSAMDEARRVRDRYADGQMVTGDDVDFLMDLLYLHSEAADKIGSGVAGFSVDRDHVYRTTRCFFVHRTDGSSTDFSFENCIKGANARR
nr:DCL family protein [Gemmatimonadaceae bacterium]